MPQQLFIAALCSALWRADATKMLLTAIFGKELQFKSFKNTSESDGSDNYQIKPINNKQSFIYGKDVLWAE